jgi:hypothetical protein
MGNLLSFVDVSLQILMIESLHTQLFFHTPDKQ